MEICFPETFLNGAVVDGVCAWKPAKVSASQSNLSNLESVTAESHLPPRFAIFILFVTCQTVNLSKPQSILQFSSQTDLVAQAQAAVGKPAQQQALTLTDLRKGDTSAARS
jgi:hypothetical protein